MKHTILTRSLFFIMACLCLAACGHSKGPEVFFYGEVNNDLFRLLQREGFSMKEYGTPAEAIHAAGEEDMVFIIAKTYPEIDPAAGIDQDLLKEIKRKRLRVYLEYPSAFPGLDIPAVPFGTQLERGVVTTGSFGEKLKPMSLLGLHNCFVLPVEASDPFIVLAKVVGFDKAEYGLTDTKTYPALFEKEGVLISMTALSSFARGRYLPVGSIETLWTAILSRMKGDKDFSIGHWPVEVKPMFGRNESLPDSARLSSIKQGVDWFYKGRFFIHPSWKASWLKYQGDGTEPFGPPVSQDKPNGDGTLGILEGHASTIYYDGSQQYRYWMRADVQGEASMALAAAGKLFSNKDYKERSANLIDYVFETSNMRAGAKDDPASPAYGLIGWATTHPGTFYGDDNARALLGMIASSAYLETDKWDKELAEAIAGNFRTTGKFGFRGERLEEKDILENGLDYYRNSELVHPSPHFESWMWACYLWLYDKTRHKPLLEKTKKAISMTMEFYPEKWLWGSSMQTQRARMILPLAWLVRVEDTEEHRAWLDLMVNEILKHQDESGAIREEIGKGKGRFRELNSNADYGTDEGSLIFRNGEEAACMLYTCNFALFSLHEAAQATGNKKYRDAVEKLSEFLTRIQVNSEKHPDLDGAWFRAFDYDRWDYWASNSDWGWGAWCTLTGWTQSWIVATQAQIQQEQGFWELTENSKINDQAGSVIDLMLIP